VSKILIIDDTPEYIEILDEILSQYNIYAAKDGKRGIELAHKIMPELILLDINMPDMNGYEVCKKIKANKTLRNIPIIFLTANEGTNFEEIGFEVGAVDFISKPFNASILKARVNTHINLYKLQTNLEHEVQEGIKEVKKLNAEMTYLAASIAEMKSKETGKHLKRVSEISYMLAIYYGMPSQEAEKLKMASILHDIGKVAIPDSILNKKTFLEEDEWSLMKQHSQIGFEMLKDSEFDVMQLASVIALEHHERWDGLGYPKALKGEEISLVGRIVSVADVFDSLLDKRSYKEPWENDEVKRYFLQMCGEQFDPTVCSILLENFDTFINIRKSLEELS
jgi:putative two-component system response regulator